MTAPMLPAAVPVAAKTTRRRILSSRLASAVTVAMTLVVAPVVDARVTRIEVKTKESPTFGGYAFPGVGPYEKLLGQAF